MIVRQGSVLMYAPSKPKKWAVDGLDENAGAQFVVGTWLNAEFLSVGHRGAFAAIVAAYVILVVYLVISWHRFFTKRENQLVLSQFFKPSQFFRAVLQSVLGCLARTPLGNFGIVSYRSEYIRLGRALGKQFDLEEFEPRVNFPLVWNSSLKLVSRRLQQGIRSEDRIERAAAFLAGDKFGRLQYAQAVAFLANQELVNAADAFQHGNVPLSRNNVLLLSRLLSVKGVLVLERSTGGLTREQLSILGVDMPVNDSLLANHRMSAVILSLADGVNNVENGMAQFAIVRDSPSFASL